MTAVLLALAGWLVAAGLLGVAIGRAIRRGDLREVSHG